MNIIFNIRDDGKKTLVLPKKALQKDKLKRKGQGVKNILNSEACNLIDCLEVEESFFNWEGKLVLIIK